MPIVTIILMICCQNLPYWQKIVHRAHNAHTGKRMQQWFGKHRPDFNDKHFWPSSSPESLHLTGKSG